MHATHGHEIITLAISNLPAFHSYFCYLNYTPSINIPLAAVPGIGSQCFMLHNVLYWIEIHEVLIEIRQIIV